MGTHYQRGVALFDTRRYREAVNEFTKGLSEAPESALALAMRAASWLNAGQLQSAEHDVREALRVDSSIGYAHYILSCVQTRRGRSREAEASAREALRFETRAVYFHRLAEVFLLRGAHHESLRFAEQGLAIDPTHGSCLMLRAKCLRALGRQQEAESCLRGLLSQNPEDPAAHHALGKLALAIGEASEARDSLREARRLNPIDQNDRDALATAHGRLLWPLRPFDKYVARFQAWSPKKRWCYMAGLATMPEVIAGTLEPPRWFTIGFFFVCYNMVVAPLTYAMFANGCGKIAFRRDLDLPWIRLLPELRRIGFAIGCHWLVSAFAVGSAYDPAGCVGVIFFALSYEIFARMAKQNWLVARLLFGMSVGVWIPLIISATFLDEGRNWPAAMEWWLVASLSSYLLAVCRR